MKFSHLLVGLLLLLVSAFGVSLHFGLVKVQMPEVVADLPEQEEQLPATCHEEALSLCVEGLEDDIKSGRVALRTSISPEQYPLNLDRSATGPSGTREMLIKQFELRIFLSRSFDRPIGLEPAPRISGSCSFAKPEEQEIEVRRLGDIYSFFERCADANSADEQRFLMINLSLSSELNGELRPLMEYFYAVHALATYEPYTFGFPVHSFNLELRSPGGDPFAAMDVGDLVFETFENVLVKPPGCFSACVFLLAAGRERLLAPWSIEDLRARDPREAFDDSHFDRLVAIHSPLPTSSSVDSFEELAELRADFQIQARAFLERFGVSTKLVDMMMTTPSGDLQFLSLKQLEELRLHGTSTMKDDLNRLDRIRKCGRDFDQRLIEFKAALEAQCDGDRRPPPGQTSPYWTCRNELIRKYRVTKRDCEFGGEYLLDLDVSFEPIEP